MLSVRARKLAQSANLWRLLREKHERRLAGECIKPLASYRSEELAKMRLNFFGSDPAYHEARQRFVFKGKPVSPRAGVRKVLQA
jgi:putative two-component system hydrogenase maturation factor HypX/HoxX